MTREWVGKTPWQELAEITSRVIRTKGFSHRKFGEDSGIVHAGTWDFAEEFELYVKKMIAQAELGIIMEYAKHEVPGFGHDAIKKQEEINKLCLEIAKREHPDS